LILLTPLILSTFPLLFLSILTSASDLSIKYESFSKASVEHRFVNTQGGSLYWISLTSENPKGTIIFSPGRSESRISYFEMASELVNHQYNVAIIEHRGQGLSSRKIRESDVGHIDHFEDYFSDFKEFNTEIRNFLPPPYYLVSSSMGAAIAAGVPEVMNSFQSAILLAPMFKIKTKNIPDWLARLILKVDSFIFSANDYAPFTGAFDPDARFEDNEYSSSPIRFKFNKELYRKNQDLRVGGPSIRWVQEALDVPQKLQEKIKLIRTKVLLLQAENDFFVVNETQNEFCKSMTNCQLVQIPRSRHALHLETDENINLILNRIVKFF
jgi:lysophospholipase